MASHQWRPVTPDGAGVVLAHTTIIGGQELLAELVITAGGLLKTRVNGQEHGPALHGITLAAGRRRYRRMLKKIARQYEPALPGHRRGENPAQMRFPL